MLKGKLVVRCMDMIATSSSSSASNDHGSLGIDHEQEHKTQSASLDMGCRVQCRHAEGGSL
jgi:hypothetical protein